MLESNMKTKGKFKKSQKQSENKDSLYTGKQCYQLLMTYQKDWRQEHFKS